MSQPQEPWEEPGRTAYEPLQRGTERLGARPAIDFEETLTRDMRVALHDFVETATVCNWCADACIDDPGMAECARLCRDVADLAALNVTFISRDSEFGAELAETFAIAARECEAVCAQHPHEHCQEAAAVLRRAIDSTWAMLDALDRAPVVEPIPESEY